MWRIILGWCLFLGGMACAPQRQPDPQRVTPSPMAELPLKAEEFRQLRTLKGHFTGGTWNADTDAFNGKRHQVMLALEQLLQDQTLSRAELVALLGEPDAVRPAPEGSAGEQLIYFWRGWHDYLFFTLIEGQPLRAEWYFAYE
jgi:hypothetical protein